MRKHKVVQHENPNKMEDALDKAIADGWAVTHFNIPKGRCVALLVKDFPDKEQTVLISEVPVGSEAPSEAYTTEY